MRQREQEFSGSPDGSGEPETESNFSAMTERVARAGRSTKTCESCGGDGHCPQTKEQLELWAAKIRENPSNREELQRQWRKASQCPDCEGKGFTAHDSAQQVTLCDYCDGSGCRSCRGSGVASLGPIDEVFTTTKCPRCPATGRFECVLCRGKGYVIPCTVRETGCSRKGKVPPGMVPADDAPTEGTAGHLSHDVVFTDSGPLDPAAALSLGRVVRLTDADAADAIALYHGPDGDRWAPTTWGRLFVLWQAVPAGQALIRESQEAGRTERGFRLKPLEVLASERNAERTTKVPSFRRRQLINQADVQARELLERMNSGMRKASAR